MSDKKPSQKPKKTNKSFEFKLPKLTETQWSYVAVGAVAIIVGLYQFVFTAGPVSEEIMINAPLQQVTAETAEQRFKRENQNTQLPDGSLVPQNMIDENTRLVQEVPFGDKNIEFRVRLPTSWVMSNFAKYGLPGEEDYTILTNVARFFGPAIEDARPYLWIEAQKLRRFMTAETLARSYMIKRGISPEALQITSPTRVQALYVDVRDLRSYAVRSLFSIEGDTMIMVSFGVPVESYYDYKDMMGLTLNSFRLARPINRTIEDIKQVKLLNVLSFNHYASWTPKNAVVTSTLRPSIEIHNPQEVNNPTGELLQGLILINAWRNNVQNTPDKRMSTIKDRLQEVSMILRDPIEPTKDLSLGPDYVSAKQSRYTAQVNTYVRKDEFDIVRSEQSKTQQEVWIAELDNGYYTTYITLITPLESTNYIVWAQNKAAYDLLLSSLKVRTAPKDDE